MALIDRLVDPESNSTPETCAKFKFQSKLLQKATSKLNKLTNTPLTVYTVFDILNL